MTRVVTGQWSTVCDFRYLCLPCQIDPRRDIPEKSTSLRIHPNCRGNGNFLVIFFLTAGSARIFARIANHTLMATRHFAMEVLAASAMV